VDFNTHHRDGYREALPPVGEGPVTRVDLASRRLCTEEGVRAYAYNDATGKRVTCRPTGNLSIAIGVDLEVGLDADEIGFLLSNRLAKVDAALRAYAWYPALDEPRGSVFLDVGFNAGVNGLLHFASTIHYATVKDWPNCSAALLDSLAAKRAPTRYEALSRIILTGNP
jgi:lysozyme